MDENLDAEQIQSERSKSASSELELPAERQREPVKSLSVETRGNSRTKGSRSTSKEQSMGADDNGSTSRTESRSSSRMSRKKGSISREGTIDSSQTAHDDTQTGPKREIRERKRKREFSPEMPTPVPRRPSATAKRSLSRESPIVSPEFTQPEAPLEKRKNKSTKRYSPDVTQSSPGPSSPSDAMDDLKDWHQRYQHLQEGDPTDFGLPQSFSHLMPTRLHGKCTAARYWGKQKRRQKVLDGKGSKKISNPNSSVKTAQKDEAVEKAGAPLPASPPVMESEPAIVNKEEIMDENLDNNVKETPEPDKISEIEQDRINTIANDETRLQALTSDMVANLTKSPDNCLSTNDLPAEDLTKETAPNKEDSIKGGIHLPVAIDGNLYSNVDEETSLVMNDTTPKVSSNQQGTGRATRSRGRPSTSKGVRRRRTTTATPIHDQHSADQSETPTIRRSRRKHVPSSILRDDDVITNIRPIRSSPATVQTDIKKGKDKPPDKDPSPVAVEEKLDGLKSPLPPSTDIITSPTKDCKKDETVNLPDSSLSPSLVKKPVPKEVDEPMEQAGKTSEIEDEQMVPQNSVSNSNPDETIPVVDAGSTLEASTSDMLVAVPQPPEVCSPIKETPIKDSDEETSQKDKSDDKDEEKEIPLPANAQTNEETETVSLGTDETMDANTSNNTENTTASQQTGQVPRRRGRPSSNKSVRRVRVAPTTPTRRQPPKEQLGTPTIRRSERKHIPSSILRDEDVFASIPTVRNSTTNHSATKQEKEKLPDENLNPVAIAKKLDELRRSNSPSDEILAFSNPIAKMAESLQQSDHASPTTALFEINDLDQETEIKEEPSTFSVMDHVDPISSIVAENRLESSTSDLTLNFADRQTAGGSPIKDIPFKDLKEEGVEVAVQPVERKTIPVTFDEFLQNFGWEPEKILGPHKGVISGDIFYREMFINSASKVSDSTPNEEPIDILQDNEKKNDATATQGPPYQKQSACEESTQIAAKICKLMPRPTARSLGEEADDLIPRVWTVQDAIATVERLEDVLEIMADLLMEIEITPAEEHKFVMKPERRREKRGMSLYKDYNSKSEYFEQLAELATSQYLSEISVQDSLENWKNLFTISEQNAIRFRDIMSVFTQDQIKLSSDLHRYLIAFLPEPMLASYITILRHSRQMKNRNVDILNKSLKQTTPAVDSFLRQSEGTSLEDFPKRWIKIGKALHSGAKLKIRDPFIDEISRTTLFRPLQDVIAICVYPNVYHEKYFDQRTRAHDYTYKLLCQLCDPNSFMVKLDQSSIRHRLTIAESMMAAIGEVEAAVRRTAKENRNKRIVLVGWGTSTYVNHRVVHSTPYVSCLIDFAFPTFSSFGTRGQCDDDICLTYCPTLFIVGENATDFDPHAMNRLRRNMTTRTGLVVIGDANDQLCLSEGKLLQEKITQKVAARAVLEHVVNFLQLDVTYQPRAELIPMVLNDIYQIDPDILKPPARPILGRTSSTLSSSVDENPLPSPSLPKPINAVPPKSAPVEQLQPSFPVAPRPAPRPAMPPRPRKRPSDDQPPPPPPGNTAHLPQKSPFSGLMMTSRQPGSSNNMAPVRHQPTQHAAVVGRPRVSSLQGHPTQSPGMSMGARLQAGGAQIIQRPPPPPSHAVVPPHRQFQTMPQIQRRTTTAGQPWSESSQTAKERARSMLNTALTNLQQPTTGQSQQGASMPPTMARQPTFTLAQRVGGQPTALRVGPPPAKRAPDGSARLPSEPTPQPDKEYLDPAHLSLD